MNDQQAVDLLRDSVEIPSPSYHEEDFARFLRETLPSWGFETRVDEAGNFIGEYGSGRERGVLLGHIDTVPGAIPVRIEGDLLHGRGSVDAKGPLVAFLAAVSRIPKDTIGGKLTVIGCTEEEVPSSKGARHIVDNHRPEWCIIGEPSGWDAITLGYKGHIAAGISVNQDRHHGAHNVDSAAEVATAIWRDLVHATEDYNRDKERLFDQLLPRLAAMTGGPDPDGYDRAHLDTQLRLPLELPPEEAKQWVRDQVAGRAKLDMEGGVPAWSGPRTTQLHRHFLAAIREEKGRGRCLLKTGTADLNIVAPAWGCPALAYGPGDAALDHTPTEHIVIPEFLLSIRILERVLGGLLKA